MLNHALIIDTHKQFAHKLQRILQQECIGLTIDYFNPGELGWPGELIHWQQYQLVFINTDLGTDDGYEWFKVLKNRTGFPMTIMMGRQPSTEQVVQSMKAGAFDFISQTALTRKRLLAVIDSVQQALDKTQSSSHSATTQPHVTHPRLSTMTTQANERLPAIEGYRVERKIGQGGMSKVYLAYREEDNRSVVIKLLSRKIRHSQKHAERMRQEFQLINLIHSQYVVRLYEHGEVDDGLYTVMEHFTGGDLKQQLYQSMTQDKALNIIRNIAEGLAIIHENGILHRDLKPANIMFRDDGSLAIIDFGIAKNMRAEQDITMAGQIVGTPNYMAPEQGVGAELLNQQVDIYSLGVVLYEMLTGRKPYAAPTNAAIIYKHAHDPVPQLPTQYFEVQPLLEKMMAKSINQRFKKASQIVSYIDQFFDWF